VRAKLPFLPWRARSCFVHRARQLLWRARNHDLHARCTICEHDARFASTICAHDLRARFASTICEHDLRARCTICEHDAQNLLEISSKFSRCGAHENTICAHDLRARCTIVRANNKIGCARSCIVHASCCSTHDSAHETDRARHISRADTLL